jgi:hypothetical protein
VHRRVSNALRRSSAVLRFGAEDVKWGSPWAIPNDIPIESRVPPATDDSATKATGRGTRCSRFAADQSVPCARQRKSKMAHEMGPRRPEEFGDAPANYDCAAVLDPDSASGTLPALAAFRLIAS